VSLWRRWWDMNQLGKVPNVEDSTLQKASQIKENTTTRGIPDDMFSLSAKELSTFNSLVSSQKGFSASMNTNKNTQFVKKKLEQQKNSKHVCCFLISRLFFIEQKLNSPKLTILQSLWFKPPGLIGDYAWDKARLENPVRRRLIGVPVNCEKLIKLLNFQSIGWWDM